MYMWGNYIDLNYASNLTCLGKSNERGPLQENKKTAMKSNFRCTQTHTHAKYFIPVTILTWMKDSGNDCYSRSIQINSFRKTRNASLLMAHKCFCRRMSRNIMGGSKTDNIDFENHIWIISCKQSHSISPFFSFKSKEKQEYDERTWRTAGLR